MKIFGVHACLDIKEHEIHGEVTFQKGLHTYSVTLPNS